MQGTWAPPVTPFTVTEQVGYLEAKLQPIAEKCSLRHRLLVVSPAPPAAGAQSCGSQALSYRRMGPSWRGTQVLGVPNKELSKTQKCSRLLEAEVHSREAGARQAGGSWAPTGGAVVALTPFPQRGHTFRLETGKTD